MLKNINLIKIISIVLISKMVLKKVKEKIEKNKELKLVRN